MVISFKILGYEIWSLDLDLGEPGHGQPAGPVDKAKKRFSRSMIRQLVK